MRHLPLFIALTVIYFGAGLATPAANAVEKSLQPGDPCGQGKQPHPHFTSGSVF
ncbi:MAG: hypothetical protein U0361_05445 [Nitrospiraceae bacterium]